MTLSERAGGRADGWESRSDRLVDGGDDGRKENEEEEEKRESVWIEFRCLSLCLVSLRDNNGSEGEETHMRRAQRTPAEKTTVTSN